MALFHPAHSEEAALAPNLWLRTRALEAWLNDKARQGWSLAAMDGTDALLRQDGGGKRYRVVAHADAGLTAFLERCEAEGWRLAGSGEDVYILEDAAGTAKEIEDGATEAYVRRRCRRKALAARFPLDWDGYCDGKDEYVRALEARALKWYRGQPA